MFNESSAYIKRRKLERKAGNQVNEKRIENQMREELKDKLQAQLLRNDKVCIEIDKRYVSMFLGIVEDTCQEYDCVQLSETLYEFSAKEIQWN